MIKVHSHALGKSIEVDRFIGKLQGHISGPTIIFFAGIHGNEPAGVFALNQILEEIKEKEIKGSIYAIAGNLWALEKGQRYQKKDLNRLWTERRMKLIDEDNLQVNHEDTAQQIDIYTELKLIMDKEEGPFYFMDLHTTSSQTTPFLTVNDSLLNRKFAEQYPVSMILGIEEYLEGPLLSYINELGFVSFGFEAGQHDSLSAIKNSIAFIYLSLVFAGNIDKESIDYEKHHQQLYIETYDAKNIYEIYFRYQIRNDEKFEMLPGYKNFQLIQKGEVLARSNGDAVIAPYTSQIFMPLYQSQGDDGFFGIRPIAPFILKISEWCRKLKVDRILPFLPGVKWTNSKRDSLFINKRYALFLAKDFLHLLGYRSRFFDKNYIQVKNREAASKHKMYKNENWYLERF